MTKVVISGYYGFENIGDEAVLAGCIKSLRKIKEDVNITVLSNAPRITENRYSVNAIARNNIKRVVKVLADSDLFLSGGGSLLQDIVGWKSIPFYTGQILVAKLLGNKTVFYAQGIGPVNKYINKKLIKWAANKSDLITLRDEKSRDLLTEYGVKKKLIKVYADPVFALQPQFKANYFRGQKTVIGVVIRSWQNNDYLKSFVEGIEQILAEISARIIIIPFHFYQDRNISMQLKEQLTGQATILEEKFTPAKIINIFSSLDFCMGIRLHSLIFAALCRTPFVGISYDPKVTSFLHKLDIESKLTVDNLSGQQLFNEFEQVWFNKDSFVTNLDERVESFKELALNNAREVLNLV